jgi:hypothetical protein
MNRRRNTDRWPVSGPVRRHHETTTRATFRASDDDREQTATRLRHAAAEGRLLAEELEQRLEAAFSARTYGELDLVVSDLSGGADRDRRRLIELVPLRPAIALGAALLIALVLIAGMLGLGIRRSSAAAPDQPLPPAISHVGPNSNTARAPAPASRSNQP